MEMSPYSSLILWMVDTELLLPPIGSVCILKKVLFTSFLVSQLTVVCPSPSTSVIVALVLEDVLPSIVRSLPLL